MKKFILLSLLLILIFQFVPSYNYFSVAESEQIVINMSFSYLYKEANYDEWYDFKIQKGEILDSTGTINNFYKVAYSFENNIIEGYIPCEFASVYKAEDEVLLVYNGKVIRETQVYSIVDNSIIEDVILQPSHEIYIYAGFDSKSEFTKVKFLYNNKVYTAQIPTINLSPNGINKGVIIALGAITALVGVVMILLGLKKKKSGTNN